MHTPRARSPLADTEPTCSAGAVSLWIKRERSQTRQKEQGNVRRCYWVLCRDFSHLVENLKKSLEAFAPVTGAIAIGAMPLPAPGA